MRMLVMLAAIAAPAMAQPPAAPPVCVRQEIVPGFEQWGRGPAGAALRPGAFASLKLSPAPTVAFVPPPARAPAPGTFGGTFALHVATPGRYSVALSAAAWIEMIGDGQRLEAVAHMHGPECSGIGKIVIFALAPGDYVVQLSEAKADAIMAMVVAGR